MPKATWINEFNQWGDAGASWAQLSINERKAINAFLTLDVSARRAELSRRFTNRTPVSLADLAMALQDPLRPVEDLYAEMLDNTHDVFGFYAADYGDLLKHPAQHPVVAC